MEFSRIVLSTKNVGGTGGGGALACQAATINVYNSTFVGNELKNESYGTGIHSASNVVSTCIIILLSVV